MVAGRKYLTWKVIYHSLEPGNDIKHYVLDMMSYMMNKQSKFDKTTRTGVTHIFKSNVGFTISQLPRDLVKGGILAGLEQQVEDEFLDSTFLENILV